MLSILKSLVFLCKSMYKVGMSVKLRKNNFMFSVTIGDRWQNYNFEFPFSIQYKVHIFIFGL